MRMRAFVGAAMGGGMGGIRPGGGAGVELRAGLSSRGLCAAQWAGEHRPGGLCGGPPRVPQASYFTRHLAVAFDWLSGRRLSADEQKQYGSADKYFVNGSYVSDEDAKKNALGLAAWSAARMRVGAIAGEEPVGEIELSRSVPGDKYNSFANCLDDAFATAAKTLDARTTAHGAKERSAVEDLGCAVRIRFFTNCGDGTPHPFFGPGAPPPPPAAPRMPKAAPADAPLWLRQDRAYQFAAAEFYALQYPQAAKDFAGIAVDKASPWSTLAGYLVARAYLRQATIGALAPSDPQPKPEDERLLQQRRTDALQEAHDELVRVARSQPAMRSAARSLQDFVDVRLQPDAQAVVLAGRLHSTTPDTGAKADGGQFRQALIDLTYLRTNQAEPSQPLGTHGARQDPAGMLDWMDAMAQVKGVDALARWRKEKTELWLLAAISAAQVGDAAVPELLHAAAAVPQTSPAFIALNYHHLRLTPPGSAARAELAALLLRVRQESLSTRNLFSELEAKSAASLSAWLEAAQRVEVGFSGMSGVDERSDLATPAGSPGMHVEDVCGTMVKPSAVRLFDEDAAVAMNHDFPLTRLADAAEARVLPPNLQFQVALATWVRAVLLDSPEVARRMSPLLEACRPAWKQVLPAYDSAANEDARYIAGLLALMRFASTEPSVRAGKERRSGFAAYDEYRQNWWCTTVPGEGETVDNELREPAVTAPVKRDPATVPLFLTAENKADAAAELSRLRKVPSASEYLGNAALAWVAAHPRDARAPEVLGQAIRVVRNSCRDDKRTPLLAHALFDVLHKNYPNSAWAARYTSWQ